MSKVYASLPLCRITANLRKYICPDVFSISAGYLYTREFNERGAAFVLLYRGSK